MFSEIFQGLTKVVGNLFKTINKGIETIEDEGVRKVAKGFAIAGGAIVGTGLIAAGTQFLTVAPATGITMIGSGIGGVLKSANNVVKEVRKAGHTLGDEGDRGVDRGFVIAGELVASAGLIAAGAYFAPTAPMAALATTLAGVGGLFQSTRAAVNQSEQARKAQSVKPVITSQEKAPSQELPGQTLSQTQAQSLADLAPNPQEEADNRRRSFVKKLQYIVQPQGSGVSKAGRPRPNRVSKSLGSKIQDDPGRGGGMSI